MNKPALSPRCTLTGVAAAVLGALPFVAMAQVPPSLDPGQLMRQQEKLKVPAIPQAPAADQPGVTSPKATDLSTDPKVKVQVKSFRLEGNRVYASDVLLPLVADLVGKEATYPQLRAAADRIAKYYRDRGFFLAQVVLPRQDVTAGVVTMRVIEGRLRDGADGVKIDGAKRTNAGMVRDTLLKALEGTPALHEEELERGILLLNDLPGIGARVTVEPGPMAETSALAVGVKEGDLLRFSVGLDNIGSRYTGAARTTLNAFVDSPSGYGDQVSATTVHSLGGAYGGKFEYNRIGYQLPVGVSGLRLGAAYSWLNYKAGHELANLDSRGEATSMLLTARYPIIRQRTTNLYVNGSWEDKASQGDTLGARVSDKKTTVGNIGLQGDHVDGWGGGGFSAASFTLANGRLNLDRVPGALAADQAGPRVNGGFTKALYSLSRVQTLNETTTLQLALQGQHTGENLDNGEKFSLGGASGVRAYPAGEGLGDKGQVITAEVRTTLAKNVSFGNATLGDVQVTGFYDHGRIQQFHDPANVALVGPNKYDLKGIGAGINMGIAGRYDMRLQFARQVGARPGLSAQGRLSDGTTNRNRVLFTAQFYF